MKKIVLVLLTLLMLLTSGMASAGKKTENIELDVPLQLQNDKHWANAPINPTGGGKKTIAEAGCALCCLSMTESFRRGEKVRPDSLAEEIEFSGDDLHWPKGYEALAKSEDGFLVKQAGPVLLECLRSGRPALVGLYSEELGSHWVVVYGCRDLTPNSPQTSQFLIRDPGTQWRTTFNEVKEYFPKIRVIRTYDVTDELRAAVEVYLAE